jgi:hypothetical protein
MRFEPEKRRTIMASKHLPDVLVSGAGWLMQFGCRLSEALRAAGYTNDDIHRLATEQGKDEMERGIAAFVEAVAGKLVNLQEFFVTRSGLYVWNEFRDRILVIVKPAVALVHKLKHYDLPENMTDEKVREKLGNGHVFEDASVFSATLAKMIDAQANGEDGDLLNNGYTNIFYVRGLNGEVFAVVAFWISDGREWSVLAIRLGGCRWFAGGRAFSATAVA